MDCMDATDIRIGDMYPCISGAPRMVVGISNGVPELEVTEATPACGWCGEKSHFELAHIYTCRGDKMVCERCLNLCKTKHYDQYDCKKAAEE